jgi:hypothetical protein
MFFTLRFAALHDDDGGDSKDDFNSDTVDIDEGNSAIEGKDLGRLSDIEPGGTLAVATEDFPETAEDEMELDRDDLTDDIPVPDTDVDLAGIPRQIENLSLENDDVLKQMVESGAYQTWQDGQGEAISISQWKLVYDSLGGTEPQLEKMLEASLDHGETPLIFTVRHDLQKTVRDLLKNGADPQETSRETLQTPLHMAVLSGSGDIARLLIDHGVDVNAADNEGREPLHLAVIAGNEDLVRLLMKHGANINAADINGSTPLTYAVNSRHQGIDRLLLENFAAPLVHTRTSSKEGLGFRVRAIQQHFSHLEGNLNFDRGQVITVTDGTHPHTWFGTYVNENGEREAGRFPSTFVEGGLEVPRRPDRPADVYKRYQGQFEGTDLQPIYPTSRDILHQELSGKERLIQRRDAIKNLIETEAIFLRDINILEEIYKGTSEACPRLDGRTIRLIFRNNHDVIKFHTSFLAQLKTAAESVYISQRREFSDSSGWNPNDAPDLLEDKDRETSLGATFCENLEQMKAVHSIFQSKSEQSTQILARLQKDTIVRVWLNECNQAAKDLSTKTSLESFLAEPSRRFREYIKLLGAIETQTPLVHPDKEHLIRAQRQLEEAIIEINQTKQSFGLVHQILSMGRESHSRLSLNRLLRKSDEKPPVSKSEDPEFEELYDIFTTEYTQLQIVINDFNNSGERDAAHVQNFQTYATTMNLNMCLAPGSSYPELVRKWENFDRLMHDLEKVYLEDHVSRSTKTT